MFIRTHIDRTNLARLAAQVDGERLGKVAIIVQVKGIGGQIGVRARVNRRRNSY